jgi:hypothetical protein
MRLTTDYTDVEKTAKEGRRKTQELSGFLNQERRKQGNGTAGFLRFCFPY